MHVTRKATQIAKAAQLAFKWDGFKSAFSVPIRRIQLGGQVRRTQHRGKRLRCALLQNQRPIRARPGARGRKRGIGFRGQADNLTRPRGHGPSRQDSRSDRGIPARSCLQDPTDNRRRNEGFVQPREAGRSTECCWWAHQGLNLGPSDYESVAGRAGRSRVIASDRFGKELAPADRSGVGASDRHDPDKTRTVLFAASTCRLSGQSDGDLLW